uniref:Uncharacterized protein n=1 Tax=Pseudictyota dubia TaxID=2749911 RepID=A0A7R9Z6P2_9STRA|mmetsp:Transcript_27184/g.50347  ORF Transcript_27184/g.50347 Transcript_27184/m.50347 type:complete len:423 (+) Transcript_27184:343-1611(+)
MSLTPPPQIPSGNDGAGAPPPPPSVGITDPPITSLSPQLAINHQQEPFSSPPTASANSIDSTSAPQPRPPKQLERRSLELLSDVSSIAAPTSVPHPPAICVPPMIRPSQNDSDPQVQVQVQVNAQPSSQAPTQVVAVRAQDAPTPPTLSAQAQAEAATREVVPTPPKGKSRKHILLSRHSPLAASPHSPALPSAKRYITIAPTPTATTASPQDTNHALLHNNHQNNQFYHHSRLLPVVTPTAGDGTSVIQNVVSNPTAHTGASESEPQAPNPPPLWIGQHSSGTTEQALPPQQPILLPAIEEEVEETKAKPNKRLRTSSEEEDRDRSKEAENMKIDPEAVAEAVARAAEQQRAELERAAMMAEVARAAQAEAQAQAQALAVVQAQALAPPPPLPPHPPPPLLRLSPLRILLPPRIRPPPPLR